MVLAGMTPMQVIVAATRNGAEFLRITRQQGAASTLYETLRRSRWELCARNLAKLNATGARMVLGTDATPQAMP